MAVDTIARGMAAGAAKEARQNSLPPVSGTDNGKVLGVEDGKWTATDLEYMQEVTYAELKAMRDGGTLTPGMYYRMTDYTTIITGSYDLSVIGASGYLHNARSAGHAFDLILLATGAGELSEAARAALHSGDAYFNGADIDAWELRYCLDNDTNKFAFANPSGKGVIYWMKDEWNNQAGYDFKNIQFLKYAMSLNAANPNAVDTGLVYNASTQPNRYAGMMQIYTALMGYMEGGSYVNPWGATGNYDFAVSYNILGTIQMAQPDATYLAAFEADWYYTFDFYGDPDDVGTDAHYDASLNQHPWVPCRENYIELETDPVAALLLQEHNHIGLGGSVWETNGVFLSSLPSDNRWNSINENRLGQSNFGNTFGNRCYGITTKNYCFGNTFGNTCYSNTFEDSCNSNTFGNDCQSNTFGNSCYSNTFGNSCSSNTFGNDCQSNTFGNSCYSNTFEDNCDSNTFGNSCYNNTFKDNCDSNTFRDNCDSNSFGDNCQSNTFGDNCDSNTFGNDCYSNTFGNSCNNNTFGNSCNNNTFGDTCYSNTFGNYCQSNTFGNYCYSNTFGNYCDSNTFGNSCYNNTFKDNCDSNQLQGTFSYLRVSDSVRGVTVPSTMADTNHPKEMVNYDIVVGKATWIVHTGYNAETAVSTTDGGTTWA